MDDNNSDSSLFLDKEMMQVDDFALDHVGSDQFKDIYRLYKYKLTKLKEFGQISTIMKKFWDLIDKNFDGEIEKLQFMAIFIRIYKLLLPIYNHAEIPNFLEGEWQLHRKK
jgi:hypothetical protein